VRVTLLALYGGCLALTLLALFGGCLALTLLALFGGCLALTLLALFGGCLALTLLALFGGCLDLLWLLDWLWLSLRLLFKGFFSLLFSRELLDNLYLVRYSVITGLQLMCLQAGLINKTALKIYL
jgi:hypothetical protein